MPQSSGGYSLVTPSAEKPSADAGGYALVKPTPETGLKGYAKKAYDWMVEGKIPITKATKPLADWINDKAVEPGIKSQVIGAIAGSLQAAGEQAEGFTSPMNALLWATGYGEAKAIKSGATAVATALKTFRVGAGIGISAQGTLNALQAGYKWATDSGDAAWHDAQEFFGGLATAAFGAAGAKHDLKVKGPEAGIPAPKPVVEPAAAARATKAPVTTLEPVSTPTGQRKLGELPEGQAGVPPATPPKVFGETNTADRPLRELPPEESGAPQPTSTAPRSTFAEKHEPQRSLKPVEGESGVPESGGYKLVSRKPAVPGQRGLDPLKEGESGLPAPAQPTVSTRPPASGQRILSTLPEGESGVPRGTEGGSGIGLRRRMPGEPLSEIQGPSGPSVFRPTDRTAPFQRALPELPASERAALAEPGFLRPDKPKATVPRTTPQKTAKTAVAAKAPVEVTAESKIPASWKPHFDLLEADARQQGFTGTREELAGKFVEQLDRALDYARDMERFERGFDDRQLVRAISKAGGFVIEEEGGRAPGEPKYQGIQRSRPGSHGNLEQLLEYLSQRGVAKTTGKITPKEFIKRGGLSEHGAPDLVRRYKKTPSIKGSPGEGQTGKSVDGMRETLAQFDEFKSITGSTEDLLTAVEDALRRLTGRQSQDFSRAADPGLLLEDQLGVRTGNRWWDPAGAAQLHQMISDIGDKMRAAGVPDSHIDAKLQDVASSAALIKQAVDAKGGSAADVHAAIEEYAIEQAEQYWAQEHMPALTAGQTEDQLSTGETQARLPGEVGAVRDVEVPDAQFELPKKQLEMRGKLDLRTGVQEGFGKEFGFDDDKGELFGGIGAAPLPPKVQAIVEGVRKNAREVAQGVVDTVRMTAALSKFNDEAVRTEMARRQTFSDFAVQEDIRRAAALDTFKAWRRVPKEGQIKALSEFERTGKFPAALDPDGSYGRAFAESNERGHGWLTEAFGADVVGEIENYVRHVFDLKPKEVDSAVRALEAPYRRSLSANRSVLRRRVLRMPLDEAIEALKKAGIKDPKVVESNPELLRQWSLNNAYRALRFKELGDYLKTAGLTKYVAQGEAAPAGWSKLNDPRFQIFFKGEQGLIKAGEYWASEPVKRILNRAVSTGFRNPFYRTLRGTNMIWNQLNLGFSAFHAIETGINAGASEIARGIQAAGRGEIGRAALSAAKGVGGVLTFGQSNALEYGLKGNAFRKAVLRGDPATMNTLNEVLKPAGARLSLEKQYLTHNYDLFRQAWSNNQYVKALGMGIGAIPEIIAKPLMEQAIPKIKLGAFLSLAEDIQRRMGDAPFTERQKAYSLAWDAVEDRFGLMTHDNLNWNRKFSEIAQLSIRSVGWSYGTVRAFGGAAIDTGKGLGNLLSGDVKGATANLLSDRVAFTLGLTTFMAMVGAYYQYLHTGKPPESTKDLFWPQDGGVDANGDPTRAQIKSYISDVVSYSRDARRTVEHKLSPELEAAISVMPWLGTNENFFGDLIRNPDDPANVQAEQVGKFLWQSFSPFSVEQFLGSRKDADTPVASVERFGGVQKAPAWVVQTPLEKDIIKFERSRLGERHRTPEEVVQSHQTQDLALQYKQATTREQRVAILRQLPHPNTKTPSTQELMAFIRRVNSPIAETWATLPLVNRVKLARQYPAEVQRRFPQDYARFVHDGLLK